MVGSTVPPGPQDYSRSLGSGEVGDVSIKLWSTGLVKPRAPGWGMEAGSKGEVPPDT